MTAYEIIQQHPEWVKNPTATRKAIEATARRYVREQNNNALIVEDLDALLIARNALLNPTDEAKDFAQIAIAGNEIIDVGAKRMAKVYALFIKGIIAELNGKAICTAAQIQEWREQYGVKLEGLKGKPERKVRGFKPIGLDEERAMKLYNWLTQHNKIACNEDDFIWYFGKEADRVNSTQPKPIEWKGQENELAYICRKCTDFTKGKEHAVNWKPIYSVIFGLSEEKTESVKGTCSKIKNQKDAYPKNVQDIDNLFR